MEKFYEHKRTDQLIPALSLFNAELKDASPSASLQVATFVSQALINDESADVRPAHHLPPALTSLAAESPVLRHVSD